MTLQEKIKHALFLIEKKRHTVTYAASQVGMSYSTLRQNINRHKLVEELEQKIRCNDLGSPVKASASGKL